MSATKRAENARTVRRRFHNAKAENPIDGLWQIVIPNTGIALGSGRTRLLAWRNAAVRLSVNKGVGHE